jgi:Heavy-metal-associated domain
MDAPFFAHLDSAVKKIFARCYCNVNAATNCDWEKLLSDCEEFNPMKTKTAIISVDNLKLEDLPALKQALQAVPGVEQIDFNVERSVAVIDFDPSQSHIDDFLRAVLKAGFKVL